MTGIIELENMEFFAYHGCFAAERKVGNKFDVYVRIVYDCTAAAATDDINRALNYQTAYKIIKEQIFIPSNLLEHLAHRIVNELYKNFPQTESIRIKISKLNPPLGGKIGATSLSLEIDKSAI